MSQVLTLSSRCGPGEGYFYGGVVKNASARIGFIGAGTVGTALALKLHGRGYAVIAASSKQGISSRALATSIPNLNACPNNQQVADACDIVFITTPDDVIAGIAKQVRWREGQSVLHCSGADSTATLQPAAKAGAQVGVMHPLQTFASASQAVLNIPGSTFALEADEPLLTTLKDFVNSMEGHYIRLTAADKAAYHASAVIASNYLVTLVKLASDLWQSFDIPREQAVAALLPLIRGTINNIETVGVPNCLTGPLSRGDIGTVQRHLETLASAAPQVLPTYRNLGLQTLPIAEAKGKISAEQADSIKNLLSQEN
jgi:predicted short-subunit dehydrogenase-like oxidoreductase (DUF2520 family)